MTETCRRPDCDESFTNQFDYNIHLLQDHEMPNETVENFPRPQEMR